MFYKRYIYNGKSMHTQGFDPLPTEPKRLQQQTKELRDAQVGTVLISQCG